jgi:hypothetical protein
MHMETMVDRMILYLGHVPSNIDDGHIEGECRRPRAR